MKKVEVKVGGSYAMSVNGKVVQVRVVEETWKGDTHTGWKAVNTQTNRPVRITSAAKLRQGVQADHSEQSDPSDAPAPEKPPAKRDNRAAKEKKSPVPKPSRVSGLDTAAEVLKAAGKPMNFKDITEAAIAKGWRTSGKTPHATLYAAAIREIAAKGAQARFRKVQRGLFEHSGVEA